jgi:hypothetical protein
MAQEKDSLIIALDEAVVTGTRIARQKSKVTASISTISRETIDRSGELNVLPLLAYQVPGFLLNDRSITCFGVGPGSGGNISIRGISGTPNNRVLVLIDGQPQYMGIFAHPIADAYSASDIERVEIQRGAASVLYGSNAMGGAINLITRKATKEGWQGSANLDYGSFGTEPMRQTTLKTPRATLKWAMPFLLPFHFPETFNWRMLPITSQDLLLHRWKKTNENTCGEELPFLCEMIGGMFPEHYCSSIILANMNFKPAFPPKIKIRASPFIKILAFSPNKF